MARAKSYLGEIIKDYGCIEDRRTALGRTYTRVFLSRRKGNICLVFKHSAWMILGGHTYYFYVEPESSHTVAEILSDIQRLPEIEKSATHVEYTEPVNYAGILIFAVALFLIVMATLHHH